MTLRQRLRVVQLWVTGRGNCPNHPDRPSHFRPKFDKLCTECFREKHPIDPMTLEIQDLGRQLIAMLEGS